MAQIKTGFLAFQCSDPCFVDTQNVNISYRDYHDFRRVCSLIPQAMLTIKETNKAFNSSQAENGKLCLSWGIFWPLMNLAV